MIVQELEAEIAGIWRGRQSATKIKDLRRQKDQYASVCNYLLNEIRRMDSGQVAAVPSAGEAPADPSSSGGDGAAPAALSAHGGEGGGSGRTRQEAEEAIVKLQDTLAHIDDLIRRSVGEEGNHVNEFWGYLSRAGFADKSHLMRQVEKYADIYTSRVSNLLPYTPYKQFLCQRQSLAHSTSSTLGRPLMEHWHVFEEQEAGLFVPAAQQSSAE